MIRILVIDDSAFMRQVARNALVEAGYEVEDFLPESAREVMERVQAFRPDLVLSDFCMPQVDGMTVARTVRRASPEIAVVILTANRDPAREAMLGTAGVRRVLHKPLSPEALVSALEEVLART